MRTILGILFLFLPGRMLQAQSDTISLPWPVPVHPSTGYQNINATFSEFRNTLSANHFHNGTDLGQPDGYPVYSSLDGIVHSLSPSSASGTNAYVRIASQVTGGWKHISYVHIEPAPGLAAGNPVVAGTTVLGTILSGQGHVHFTERELVSTQTGTGVETNSLRSGGGFAYTDTWAPAFISSTLKFYRTGTRSPIPPSALFGKVDIVIQVMERNSPESLGGTRTNNGTYALGYRILSADTQTVVYAPPDSGLRYRFDRKPNDAYVGYVFDESVSTTSAHHYFVTNGQGASNVSSTRTILPNWFDADQLPPGEYILEVFAFDTRANTTTMYVPVRVTDEDLSPPDRPRLLSVIPDSTDIRLTWLPPADPDVNGFRLYVHSSLGGDFIVAESTLTKGMTTYDLRLPVDFPAPQGGLPRVELRLTAVDTATVPNEGAPSDTYVATPGIWNGTMPGRTFLIVDGFDRFGGSGSWSQPAHTFALSDAQAYPAHVAIGTAANEMVEAGLVGLHGYDLVQWILGDESTTDNTLTSAEQSRIRTYLEEGGSLIISGSELGWDLGRAHTATEPGDLSFYNNYLKAQYVFDGNSSMTTATGVTGTPFQGYTWTFGQVFPEDYPDDIEPMGGAVPLLTYNSQRDATTWRKAGIGYVGTFGSSQNTGRMVYLSFPFESLSSPLTRQVLFEKSLEFLGVTTGVARDDRDEALPLTTRLSPNYPNPFNPRTEVRYQISDDTQVRLSVFDVLGREVAVLVNEHVQAGEHRVTWEAGALSSGIYFIRLDAGPDVFTHRALLLK